MSIYMRCVMNRWIIATAVVGVMSVPVFGKNPAAEPRPAAPPAATPATTSGRLTEIKPAGAPVQVQEQELGGEVIDGRTGGLVARRVIIQPTAADGGKHEKV